MDGGGTLSGCLGVVPYKCAHAYLYKHDNFMQMAAPIGCCYIVIDLDLSKSKGMPQCLKLHSALASCSFTTKYINKAKT